MAQGIIPIPGNGRWAGKIEWSSEVVKGKLLSSVKASCFVWRIPHGISAGSGMFEGEIQVGTVRNTFHFLRLGNAPQFAGSCWAEVPHGSDGTGTAAIRVSIQGAHGSDLAGTALIGRGDAVLDPVPLPKASQVSLGAERAQMGKFLKITIAPDHKDCRHQLTYQYGHLSGTIAEEVENEFLWKLPDLTEEERLEGSCTVTCRTFLGQQDLGSTQADFILQVPDPVKAEAPSLYLLKEGEILCPGRAGNFSLSLCLILSGKEYAVGEGKQDRFLFTPSAALGKLQPDRKILQGKLRCDTFLGPDPVGTRETEISITVEDLPQTRPQLQNLKLRPWSRTLPESYGYLRGKTGLEAAVEASSDCSEISEVRVTAGKTSAVGNPAVIAVLEDGGSLKVQVRVRDARGFESSLSQEIQVVPYEKPRVIPCRDQKTVICQRSDEQGGLTDRGKFLAIFAGTLCTQFGPEGVNENRCRLLYRIRKASGTFSPWTDLLAPGETETKSVLPDLLPSSSYQAELMAKDILGETTTMGFSVLSETISFGLYDGPDGAAFGKYPEQPHVVDLAPQMTLLVRGKLDLPGESWQDLGLAPGISPGTGGGARVQGAKVRLHGGNHVFLAFSCSMPGNDQVINGKALPESLRPGNAVTALCPSEGGAVLAVCSPNGFLTVQPVFGKQDPAWIDGALDYFI